MPLDDFRIQGHVFPVSLFHTPIFSLSAAFFISLQLYSTHLTMASQLPALLTQQYHDLAQLIVLMSLLLSRQPVATYTAKQNEAGSLFPPLARGGDGGESNYSMRRFFGGTFLLVLQGMLSIIRYHFVYMGLSPIAAVYR